MNLLRRLQSWFETLTWSRALAISLVVIGLTVAIRLVLAWKYYGFMFGDELEVQQLALSRLIGYDFQAWTLRNSTYPLVFVYPMQWLWHLAGARDPAILLFAGRLMVVLFTALNIVLIFKAMKRSPGIPAAALLAVVFLAFEFKAVTFGSTVLPRNVTTTFVLLGYIALTNKSSRMVALGGAAIGVAAALRFSEVIFIAPAAIDLILRRQFRLLVPLAGGFVASAAAILALSDWIYWGRAFASLEAFARYTLLEGRSTHGYQPPWFYPERIGKWVNHVTFLFACVGVWHRRSRALTWVVVPIVLLSLLPHKEARYVLPVLPFLAMLAGEGAWHALQAIVRQRRALPHYALILLAVVWAGLNVKRYPSPRSEDAVRAARLIGQEAANGTLALEWGVRFGEGIYLNEWPQRELLPPLHGGTLHEFEALLSRPELTCLALHSQTVATFGPATIEQHGWTPMFDPIENIYVYRRGD